MDASTCYESIHEGYPLFQLVESTGSLVGGVFFFGPRKPASPGTAAIEDILLNYVTTCIRQNHALGAPLGLLGLNVPGLVVCGGVVCGGVVCCDCVWWCWCSVLCSVWWCWCWCSVWSCVVV